MFASSFRQNAPWLRTAENKITPETPFSEAADLWMDSIEGKRDIGFGQLRRVRPNSVNSYRA